MKDMRICEHRIFVFQIVSNRTTHQNAPKKVPQSAALPVVPATGTRDNTSQKKPALKNAGFSKNQEFYRANPAACWPMPPCAR
jgi:hypothetical protein